LITQANPAQPGEYISLYLTGLGTVTPPVSDGALGPTNPLSLADVNTAGNLTVLFNDYVSGSTGNTGTIQFAGLAPGLAGLYQINVQVPTGVLGSGDNVYVELITDYADNDQIQIPYGSSSAARTVGEVRPIGEVAHADAPLGELVDQVEGVAHGPPEPVEGVDHDDVAVAGVGLTQRASVVDRLLAVHQPPDPEPPTVDRRPRAGPARRAGATSLHENLDTTTPGDRLVFYVFAALAEFIRELIVIGTNEGLAAARARGRIGGRPTVATEEIIRAARDLLPDPGRSITSIAKLLGVSPGAPSTTTSRTSRNSGPVPYPASLKPPRSRPTPARSISPGFPVPQLLTPGDREALLQCRPDRR